MGVLLLLLFRLNMTCLNITTSIRCATFAVCRQDEKYGRHTGCGSRGNEGQLGFSGGNGDGCIQEGDQQTGALAEGQDGEEWGAIDEGDEEEQEHQPW